jgi:hypothetical protein
MPSLPWPERSLFRQQAANRGGGDASSSPSRGLDRALARSGGGRLELASRGSRASALRVRTGASIRGRSAPRHRRRRRRGRCRCCAGLGNRDLCRHRPVVGEERHDRNTGWVFGDADSSRHDRCDQERSRRGRGGRRHGRTERRRRGRSTVRPPGRTPDRAGAGLSRSAEPAARARGGTAAGARARTQLSADAGSGCSGRPRARAGGGAWVGAWPGGRGCAELSCCRADSGRHPARGGGCGPVLSGRGGCAGPGRPAPDRCFHQARGAGRGPLGREQLRQGRECSRGRCAERAACRRGGVSLGHDRRSSCPGPRPSARVAGNRRLAGRSPAAVPARSEVAAQFPGAGGRTAGRFRPAVASRRHEDDRADARARPGVPGHEPCWLPRHAAARPRRGRPRSETPNGRTYHCSRCAST